MKDSGLAGLVRFAGVASAGPAGLPVFGPRMYGQRPGARFVPSSSNDNP